MGILVIEIKLTINKINFVLTQPDIQKNKVKLDEALEVIKKATGHEYTFDEACFADIVKQVPKDANGVGHFIYGTIMPCVAKL